MTDGPNEKKKVAVACQGGGIHAFFSVGVLIEILKNIEQQNKAKGSTDRKRLELVGLSGTSAGALCALMVWYVLAPKNGRAGAKDEAIKGLEGFGESFTATASTER